MRKINVLTTVFILLALFSCRKDDVFTEVDDPVFPDPGVELVSNYTGIVVNEEGLAVADAEVIDENGNITITDQNGYFKVAQGNFTQGGSLFKVKKTGFIDAFKFVHLKLGQSAYTKVTLLERKPVGNVQSNQGGQLEIGSAGARINISANSVVKEDGTVYSGGVQVYAHWYDPTDQKLVSSMPGDLRGIDEDNEKLVLETYGMMSVELEGDNGEPLNLQENTSATLTFPIAQEQAGVAPDEIPLWSLDENTGYWKEEGVATREGNFYYAEVSHFSFWNCDWPYPLVEISGTVKDTEGNLLQNVELSISINDGGTTCYGYTDALGYFEGLVPQDEMLTLKVYYENCEGLIFSKNFDPLSEDANLGDIVLELVGNKQISYSGSVLKCDPQGPVTNGYVTVKDADGIILSTSNIQANGTYSGTLALCSSTDLTFQAVNLDDLTLSQEVFWQSTEIEFYEVENLNTCEDVEEYFIITIDGETTSYVELIEGNTINNIFRIRYNAAAGAFEEAQVYLDISNLSDIKVRNVSKGEGPFFFCDADTGCSDMVANITNYPTQVGEFIVGNVEGVIEFEGVTYEVKVDFRAQLDKEEFEVYINTWADLNENGIYDSDSEQFSSNGTGFQVTQSNMAIFEAFEVSNGRHLFRFQRGAIADIEVLLNGNSLTANESKEYACGIIPGAMSCSSPSTIDCGNCAEVEVQGGIPPYTLIVNGQVIAPTPNGAIIYCGQAGQYAYVVEDANGDECSGTLVISQSNVFEASLNEIIYKCENGEVLADVDVNITGGTAPYMFEWSNGSVTEDLVELSPGIYSLIVIDANGCETWLSSFTIESNYIEITGKVWDDNFGSIPNEYDSEQGIAGVDISLIDENSGVIQTVTTDADGNYSFTFWIFISR